jgi:hypothetical protein
LKRKRELAVRGQCQCPAVPKANRVAATGIAEVHSRVSRHSFSPFVKEKLFAVRRKVGGSRPLKPGEIALSRRARLLVHDAAAGTGLKQQYTAVSRDLLQAHPTWDLQNQTLLTRQRHGVHKLRP